MKKFSTAVRTLGFVGVLAAGMVVLPRGYAAWRELAARDDPAELSERRLDRHFDAAVAAREINSALDAGDVDLATSFVTLAHDRGVPLDPALLARIDVATGAAESSRRGALSFARGLVTGVPEDTASLAGTAVGDLFVFGDVRDAARESWHAARGQEVDKVVLGLSLAGIAITAGTYVTLGAAAPARVGVTLLKGAAKTEELGGRLARLIRFERTGEVVQVAGDLGRVQAKAGTRAAIEGLKLAEGPKDVERVAQLAAKEGGKTRAVIKLLGRGAIMLGAAAFELTSWVFWALINLLGLVVAIKRWVERATLNSIRRGKARSARAAAVQPLASPA